MYVGCGRLFGIRSPCFKLWARRRHQRLLLPTTPVPTRRRASPRTRWSTCVRHSEVRTTCLGSRPYRATTPIVRAIALLQELQRCQKSSVTPPRSASSRDAPARTAPQQHWTTLVTLPRATLPRVLDRAPPAPGRSEASLRGPVQEPRTGVARPLPWLFAMTSEVLAVGSIFGPRTAMEARCSLAWAGGPPSAD